VTTRHIDYARWFITLLLFWYGAFYFSIRFDNRYRKIVFLFMIASGIFLLDYYVTRIGWYQIYSFPIGVFLAYYFKEIEETLTKINKAGYYKYLPVIGLFIVVIYHLYCEYNFMNIFPSIANRAIREVIGILFSFSLILTIGYAGYKGVVSRILCFVGIISYEMFLLHGPFLIKYNPILSANNIVGSFYIWLAAIVIICTIFIEELSCCIEHR